MGGKRHQLKKIEKPTSLQVTYSKRKEGLVRKVNEISILCDTDAGLLMFSPAGRLTCVTSPGSKIEDIFLRFINEPDELHGTIEHEEHVYRKLKHSKYEAEMLELINTKETLQRKLDLLNRHLQIAGEKMRYYHPDVMRITSIYEAEEHEKYLTDAIERIGRMKARLQQKENFFRVARPIQLQSYGILDRDTSEKSVNSTRMRVPSMTGNPQYGSGAGLLTRPPQLGAGYLTNQIPRNFPSARFASSSKPMGNFNGGQIFSGVCKQLIWLTTAAASVQFIGFTSNFSGCVLCRVLL